MGRTYKDKLTNCKQCGTSLENLRVKEFCTKTCKDAWYAEKKYRDGKLKSCKVCGTSLEGKRGTHYCSNECKLQDLREKNTGITRELDPTKNIRCKITGKVYKDYENYSGCLTIYSRDQLNKDYDPNDWEVINVEPEKYLKCEYCDWKTKDLTNKSGWFTVHLKREHNKSMRDYVKEFPQHKQLYTPTLKRREDVNFGEDNHVVCKECGDKVRMINYTHLKKCCGLSVSQYRAKHGGDLVSTNTSKALQDRYYKNESLKNSIKSVSKAELEITQFISSSMDNPQYDTQFREYNFEIDIMIPTHSFGIEYNGLYWHSESAGSKPEKYHISKTQACEEKGVKLVHIFEDEWSTSEDVVKSILLHSIGKTSKRLYARNCTVREIDSYTKNMFLEANNVFGKDKSNIALGLFSGSRLQAVMTFVDETKHSGQSTYKLSRFCTRVDTHIAGGASKMFKFFERRYNPSMVICFADRRWVSESKDSFFRNLGFVLDGKTKPKHWYMDNYQNRLHRREFTKHKILEKYPEADPNKSEWVNMQELGFDRIWDCGSLKYLKEYQTR